jgi:hypothetical protein
MEVDRRERFNQGGEKALKVASDCLVEIFVEADGDLHNYMNIFAIDKERNRLLGVFRVLRRVLNSDDPKSAMDELIADLEAPSLRERLMLRVINHLNEFDDITPEFAAVCCDLVHKELSKYS